MEQNTSSWLAWRKLGIGASEAAAVMGLSPWSTAYDVFLEKTGRKESFEGNLATRRGQDLEGKARLKYEFISLEDMAPAVAVHPKYDFLRASLDGVSVDGKKILEIKCPSESNHEKVKTEGVVPSHYQIQVQHQLAVTGAEKCDFFSYSYADGSHALIEVLPNLETQAQIILKLEDFWLNHVMKDIPSPLTDRDTKVITDNPDIELLCKNLLINKTTLSKVQIDTLKAAIIEMSEHPKMMCGRVRISTVNKNGKFSYHKLTISGEE